MSHPARLSLRAPPHLPFIQGWPGIPSSSNRPEAGVHGTVEVRIGPAPIKAKWVRVEIRKYESLPPGFPGSISQGETWEHVGEISNLWKAAEGKECDDLQQADFKFYLPLPETIPPSVELAKGTGVRYELVAALCYRQKGGLFKKEAYPIMKISEALRITKHELHSAWPLYNVPDSKSGAGPSGEVGMVVQRPGCAFGPTDRILLTATIRSSRPKPFKLKGFDCSLHEIITAHPSPASPTSTKSKKGKSPSQPVTKSKVVATTRCAVDETVARGGEKSARIDMAIPAEKLLVTVKNGRSLEVEYELEVKAVCTDGVQEVKVAGIRYVVGTFARGNAQQAVRDIGHVDALCPAPPGMIASNPQSRVVSSTSLSTTNPLGISPSPRTSMGQPSPGFPPQQGGFPPEQPGFPPHQPGFPPQQQQQRVVQGFIPSDPRRKSSTSTVTTMTTMAQDHNASPTVRPFSTLPNQRTGNLTFPTPNSAPNLVRSATMNTFETSMIGTSTSGHTDVYSQSEAGHGEDNMRYSTNTTATFGKWDKGLKTALNLDDAGTLMSVSETSPTTPTSSRPPDRSTTVSPSTPGPSTPPASRPTPSTYANAEDEKVRLYNSARSRAAANQSATGASLDQIGLDDLAPPEYAPPRPALPDGGYRAPERPVSVYTSGTVSPSMSNAETVGTGMADVSGSRAGTHGNGNETYMTAAEEKEAQKSRFEAAANRVVSGGRRSIGPSPLASATTSPNLGTTPLLINSVRTPDESPVPYDAIFPSGAPSSSSSVPNKPMNGLDSALSEKEQMRRYHEAQDKVNQVSNRNVSGGSQGAGGSSNQGFVGMQTISDAPSAVSRIATSANNLVLHSRKPAGTPGTIPNGFSEKEQMKRYYEAQDKVNQVSNRDVSDQNGGGSSSVMVPESVPLSEGSRTSIDRVATPANELVLKARGGGRNNILTGSGGGEKEQMKRYHEAQDRVNQGGPTYTPTASNSDPPAQPVSAPSASISTSMGQANGLSEKEQMRRYYEAQDKVNQQSSGSSTSAVVPPPPAIIPPFASSTELSGLLPTPPITTPAIPSTNGLSEKEQMQRYHEAQDRVAQSSRNGTLSSTNPSPNSSRIAQPPTVNNREEQMKRYYEAMQRVARHSAGSSGAGPPPVSPRRVTSPSPSIDGYFSAEQEKEMMRKRFDNAQAAVAHSAGGRVVTSPIDSPLVRDPTIRAGKARALVSPVEEGPPPPLPAKPPMEYINLLSPVDDVDRQLGGGGVGLEIAGTMGMAPLGSVLGEEPGRGGASRAGSRSVSGSTQDI